MPQSLARRFNGNASEVIEYTRVWGRHKAMDRYGVRDYLAFCRFIEAETGDPNFGLSGKIPSSDNKALAESLLDAFVAKIQQMETEKQALQSELQKLSRELDYYKTQRALSLEPKLRQVMEVCQP